MGTSALAADGSTTDLWDVCQGTVVTATSGLSAVSSAHDLFGATETSVEPGSVLFRDDLVTEKEEAGSRVSGR